MTLERNTVIVAPRGRPPVLGRRLFWRDAKAFASRWRPAPIIEPRALPGEPPVEAAAPKDRSPGSADLAMDRMMCGPDLFPETRA